MESLTQVYNFCARLLNFLKKNIKVQLICNVVLISAVQQSDSVIHTYPFSDSFPLWFIIGY